MSSGKKAPVCYTAAGLLCTLNHGLKSLPSGLFVCFSFRLFLVFNHIFRTSAKPIHSIPGAAINIIVLYKSLLLLGLRERKQVHFLLSAFQSVSQSSVTGSGLESTLISLRESTSGDLPSREINSAKGLQRFSRTCSHLKSHTNSHFTKY